ncbi:eCIS core domain-containing protein, partial [Aphanizomenon flos-aquae]
SGVKVHTDGESDQLNKSLNSRAFATGQDIFFSQGAYNPGSRDGQELLAHELTHVVQQNGGVQRKIVQHQTTEQKIVQMMPKVKSGNLSVKDAQIALAKANKELAFELAQTAADIAGIVDPTPISDGISAAMSLAKGDYVGAGLSIVSMIPYLGDTIGKPIKAARNGKKILKLRKEIAELIQIIEKFSPAGRKASAKTKDAVAQEIKQVLKPTLGNTPKNKGKIKLLTQFSESTIDKAVDLVVKDGNKLIHLFPSKHNLKPLVSKLGGKEKTIRAVLNAANGKLPISGIFKDIPVNVAGVTVLIRGNVIDGVPRLGTMFIKSK